MPPPLTPPPAPATQHMPPSMYQISYGHHHAQQGRIPSFSAQQLYFPTGAYGRPETAPYAAAMGTHLNASSPHHQAPYRLAPLPGAPSAEGSLISPPIVGTAIHTAEVRVKTKAVKPRPKKSPPTKIVKPRAPKPGKVKQRPQMAKHLTPSLRAAIITLKVTDPSRSFKEIGKILSLPADDDDDEDDEDGDNDNDSSAEREQRSSKDGGVGPATTAAATAPSEVNGTTRSTAESNMPSGATNGTEAGLIPATSTTTTATAPKAKSKTRTKSKGPARKPIPRNTVAGIFKRAVDRAGTDSDLFKLLEQTGRRAGSGRPRKGTGRKDREQQADVTSATPGSTVPGNTGAAQNTTVHTNPTQPGLDTQSLPPITTHDGTGNGEPLSQNMPALTHEDSWQTHLANDSINGNIHDSINEDMNSGINGAINGISNHSPTTDADLTLDMGLDDDDDDGRIDMDGLEMDALDMPDENDDDVERSGWSTDADGGDDDDEAEQDR